MGLSVIRLKSVVQMLWHLKGYLFETQVKKNDRMDLMKQTKASILIIEDDAALLQGLLDVLVFNGYAVKGIKDGGIGLRAGLEEVHDLILLDIMLPTCDGFSICKKIRKKKPTQGIIMITAKGSEDDIVTGFKAGADDYISKPFSLREVMVRVEAVLRRMGKHLDDLEIHFRDIFFDGKNLKAEFEDRRIELTRREMDIITYLYYRQNQIVSKKKLLIDVWHYADVNIETRTVDIHMLKLRKKIATLIGSVPFITTIRGEGYRLETGK